MHFYWYHIPLLLGIAMLIFGVYRLKRYIRLRKQGVCVEGSVYDIVIKEPEYKNTHGAHYQEHFMVIGFLTENQKLIIEEINVTFNPYEYKKGDTVNVLYKADNPEKFMLDNGKSPAYTYFLCLFPGVMFIVIGMWMICMQDVNAFG